MSTIRDSDYQLAETTVGYALAKRWRSVGALEYTRKKTYAKLRRKSLIENGLTNRGERI